MNKAEFRATMEMLGMGEAFLAREVGVDPEVIEWWESDDCPDMPTEEACETLRIYTKMQRNYVTYALGRIDEIAQENGSYPNAITIHHWDSQLSYDEHHDDDGDYRMANANNRLVAFAMFERSIPVEWIDDDEEEQ